MSRQIALGHGAQAPVVLERRIRELEATVATLAEATALLARALEGSPLAGPNGADSIKQAAKEAYELLIAAGLPSSTTKTTDK
ncbi:MAG TPA: hypothetical protein VH912_28555 [Streptosporangiaceae bacterium]|jgi:hypothetical protein